LFSLNRFDEAIPLFVEKLGVQKARLGIAHADTIRTAFNLGANYRQAGRLEDALALFDEWLARALDVLPPNHPAFGYGLDQGLQTYERAGRCDKAEPFLRKLVVNTSKAAGAATPPAAGTLALLGLNLLQQKKHTEAETVLRECLMLREKIEPEAWTTFNTKSMLGGALLGQKKYAAAEPLLLAGHEGMKKQEAKIPPPARSRLTDAVERLVQLYEATGKKDEAVKWRKKLRAREAEKPRAG
jgi:tetratricopeptide (TPR) repeat protein